MQSLANHGSASLALKLADRACNEVTAYRRHLDSHGIGAKINDFDSLPLTDKSGYISNNSYADLLVDDVSSIYSIFASSGSSGHPFYWPQISTAGAGLTQRIENYLVQSYQIDQRSTLAIIGLALGSWIGGEHLSWALKNVAHESRHPFAVFSPGSQYDEILRMLQSADSQVDQFLICLCPSAIRHLHACAERDGVTLPHAKMRYLVMGEPFPETLRHSLSSTRPMTEPAILSFYGSADTGFLGAESAASAAVRRLLSMSPELTKELGFDSYVPHFFHAFADDAYLEVVDGELCVTRWQGIPLVRYNLHDNAQILSWVDLCTAVQDSLPDATSRGLLALTAELPDILAISGRSDSMLILCGTNFSEAMLDEAMQAQTLSTWLTGNYRAQVVYHAEQQRLHLDVETRPGVDLNPSNDADVYALIVAALSSAQPEFESDWRNIYHHLDHDIEQRILEIDYHPWPAMGKNSEAGAKQRGLARPALT